MSSERASRSSRRCTKPRNETPNSFHFPIHYLQELQEQRGGLRVSALGSAALSAPSEWRVAAFQSKAATIAISSSFLALKTSKDVFSRTKPHVETSIFSKEIGPFRPKGDCPFRKNKERQTTPNGAKRRRLYYRPPQSTVKHVWLRIAPPNPNSLKILRFSKWCSPTTLLKKSFLSLRLFV